MASYFSVLRRDADSLDRRFRVLPLVVSTTGRHHHPTSSTGHGMHSTRRDQKLQVISLLTRALTQGMSIVRRKSCQLLGP